MSAGYHCGVQQTAVLGKSDMKDMCAPLCMCVCVCARVCEDVDPCVGVCMCVGRYDRVSSSVVSDSL